MHQLHKPGLMNGGRERETIKMFKEALQRAKRVAETTYSVVGIVEEFNITLAVMEAYLPGG